MKLSNPENLSNIENLFKLFSGAAMAPRPYVEKKPLPATVTIALGPEEMKILQIISARIGAPRQNVAHHVLKLGLYEAACGCGFSIDEEGQISEDQLKWEVTPKSQGFSFGDNKEVA